MQLTPEEDAELDGLKARLDAGDLKRGSAEFGRMMALARRRRDAIAAAHAAAAALLPPPPPPPAPLVPLPDPAKFRARQDRDLRELLDLIRSEIAEALGGSLPAAEPAPYIDASERPVEEVVGPLAALKAKIDAVRAGQQELTPDELLQMYRDDPPGAAAKLEDAVRALKGDARRKLSELLNVELAELKNLRGMAGEDREREQQIEYLLGLFTRLGEI